MKSTMNQFVRRRVSEDVQNAVSEIIQRPSLCSRRLVLRYSTDVLHRVSVNLGLSH